jgi:hypothetical protein
MFVSSIMYNNEPPAANTLVAATITISNAGNGTITLNHNIGGGLVTAITVSSYKTKSLFTIQQEIVGTWYDNADAGGAQYNFIARIMAGVNGDRTYRFHEVTDLNIYQPEHAYGLEAIDDTTDAVTVDGCEFFPNRIMWSNALYPEEINPLNVFDLSKDDAYPIHGLFRNDFTLGMFTSEHVWLLTGSLSADPDTFKPDFSIAATNSEAGNFCTRPDSIAVAPEGVFFIAEDGLRLYAGGRSKRIARGIDTRLLARIVTEPRCRDNVCLYYSRGKIYIAFPGMEVA